MVSMGSLMPIKIYRRESLVAISSCIAIGGMLAIRLVETGNNTYWFLIWNIFLAWTSWVLSIGFISFVNKKVNRAMLATLAIAWLLFLPNAFYVATDVVHLAYLNGIERTEYSDLLFSNDPAALQITFDSVLILLAVWVSWFFGIASMLRMHKWANGVTTNAKAAACASVVLLASSFAIYLGRFPRFNSWDVIGSPLSLASDIIQIFIDPAGNSLAYVVTGLYFLLSSVVYWSIYYARRYQT